VTALPWINLLLPGSGLLVRDHLAVGCTLVLAWFPSVAGVLGAELIALDPFAGNIRLAALGWWLVLSAVAGLFWWLWERPYQVDDAALNAVHKEAASAYLRSDWAPALAAARRAVRMAPRHPGAWGLLRLVADGAGSTKEAHLAGRKQQRFLDRQRGD
jgi:hypothetical protein